MKVTAAAVLALAATVAADNVRFTRAAPAQLGRLARREDDGAYEPELLECGEGNTCAEACGAGYEQCESSASENHCFNPAAGETCCTFLGLGCRFLCRILSSAFFPSSSSFLERPSIP